MKLYDAPWAPSPRRVRIYLAEKQLEVAREILDLRTGAHLTPEFLKVNPRGTVPALQLDDGEVLTESSAICRYFEALHPNPPMFGASPIEQARVERWTRQIEGDGYAAAVYVLRNSVASFKDRAIPNATVPTSQIPELARRGMAMWLEFTKALDRQLSDHQWVAGDVFSFADITALVTIDFARAAKLLPGETLSNLRRWHEAATARPSASA